MSPYLRIITEQHHIRRLGPTTNISKIPYSRASTKNLPAVFLLLATILRVKSSRHPSH